MANIRLGGMQPLPPVIKNLIIINALMWVAQLTFGETFTSALSLHYYKHEEFGLWQFVTYMFLHSPAMFFHILFNMLMLWMFGSSLETFLGSKRFLIFYLVCGIGAGLLQMLANVVEFNIYTDRLSSGAISEAQYISMAGPVYNSIALGASGAVMGVMAAYAFLFPNTELIMIPIPIPIKAKYYILGLILLDLFGGINPKYGGQVAHFAHLGGALFGFILIKFMNSSRRGNRRDYY